MRTFRVDRIQELTVCSETFQKPDDFDVQAYLDAAFKDQPGIQARLRFSKEAAHIALSNLSGWESTEENPEGAPEGSVDVTLSAPDLNWLASLVLSFTTWVEVLDPPELREMVREWALATAAQYPSNP